MRTARFFIPETWVAKSANAFTIPSGAIQRQIAIVLRMKAGDAISLMTNDGAELEGIITEVGKSSILGVITGSHIGKPITPHVTVCAAMTKRDTYEWMLQKCTELGATTFIPMISDRVIKRPKEAPQRWRDIVREASEQSGRVTMPEILEPMSFSQALKKTQQTVRILFHESGGSSALPKAHATSDITLFIGPEGGFSDPEVADAKNAGAHIVTLGNLVLRAETAAIVALARIMF